MPREELALAVHSIAMSRRVALAPPETEERKHMNHPDVRVAGKIFANTRLIQIDLVQGQVTPLQPEEFVNRPRRINPCTEPGCRQAPPVSSS